MAKKNVISRIIKEFERKTIEDEEYPVGVEIFSSEDRYVRFVLPDHNDAKSGYFEAILYQHDGKPSSKKCASLREALSFLHPDEE